MIEELETIRRITTLATLPDHKWQTHSMISRGIIDSVDKAAKEQSEMKVVRGWGAVAAVLENGKSKRRDYKRENFPGLTVSYRGLVEYQAEIVSASRTRDKLPFLSSPSFTLPYYARVYRLSSPFHHLSTRICASISFTIKIPDTVLGKILGTGKENWDYSLWEYSSSKALARARALTFTRACDQ